MIRIQLGFTAKTSNLALCLEGHVSEVERQTQARDVFPGRWMAVKDKEIESYENDKIC